MQILFNYSMKNQINELENRLIVIFLIINIKQQEFDVFVSDYHEMSSSHKILRHHVI